MHELLKAICKQLVGLPYDRNSISPARRIADLLIEADYLFVDEKGRIRDTDSSFNHRKLCKKVFRTPGTIHS